MYFFFGSLLMKFFSYGCTFIKKKYKHYTQSSIALVVVVYNFSMLFWCFWLSHSRCYFPALWMCLISSSLRPRTSSSSSQPERAVSPLVVSSTHSLEAMPRFALSTDDEGKLTLRMCHILWVFCYQIYCPSQLPFIAPHLPVGNLRAAMKLYFVQKKKHLSV